MQVFAAALALARHLGMQTCLSQDRPGFVINRMLLPLINEAFFLLMEVTPLVCTGA
jgi:3-hydroxybutyryl-CoA dehydrogenase